MILNDVAMALSSGDKFLFRSTSTTEKRAMQTTSRMSGGNICFQFSQNAQLHPAVTALTFDWPATVK